MAWHNFEKRMDRKPYLIWRKWWIRIALMVTSSNRCFKCLEMMKGWMTLAHRCLEIHTLWSAIVELDEKTEWERAVTARTQSLLWSPNALYVKEPTKDARVLLSFMQKSSNRAWPLLELGKNRVRREGSSCDLMVKMSSKCCLEHEGTKGDWGFVELLGRNSTRAKLQEWESEEIWSWLLVFLGFNSAEKCPFCSLF